MPAPYPGGCACGAIRYTVTAEPYTSYCCHCRACQKRTAESGNVLTVHFCGDCGTSLYSASTGRPHVHVLYIGTLDDPAAVPPRLHIWTDYALPWVHLDPALPATPRQPEIAKYYVRPPER